MDDGVLLSGFVGRRTNGYAMLLRNKKKWIVNLPVLVLKAEQ